MSSYTNSPTKSVNFDRPRAVRPFSEWNQTIILLYDKADKRKPSSSPEEYNKLLALELMDTNIPGVPLLATPAVWHAL